MNKASKLIGHLCVFFAYRPETKQAQGTDQMGVGQLLADDDVESKDSIGA